MEKKKHNCNAHIYFNKQCLRSNLIPNYAKIKISNTSPASKYTQKKVHTLRIEDDIKFLCDKIQNLNQKLYHRRLNVAIIWPPSDI